MSSILKILVDTPCSVYCDYEFKGEAKPHSIFKIELRKGQYLLEFKVSDFILATEEVVIESSDEDKLLRMSLSDEFNKNIYKRELSIASTLNVEVKYNSGKPYLINHDRDEMKVQIPDKYKIEYYQGFDSCGLLAANVGGYDTYAWEDYQGRILEGKWGCLSKSMIEQIPFIYEEKVVFTNQQVTCAKLSGKIIFIDKWGDVAFENIYDDVSGYIDNLCIVEKNSKFGIIDEKGNSFLPLMYDNISYVNQYNSKRLYIITRNGLSGVIDNSRTIIIPVVYDAIKYYYEKGFVVSLNGKKGLLGVTGEILLPIEFQEIEYCHEGYIVDKDYFRGCYNEKMELILPFIYKIPQIKCYWPIVRKAEKLGMLNKMLISKSPWDLAGIKELKEIIPCIYDDVYNEQGVSLKISEENHTSTWYCKMPYFLTNLQNGTKRFSRYELKQELNVYVSAVIVETFDCDNFTSYSIKIGNKEYLGRKKIGKGFDKIEIGSVNIYQEQIGYFTFIDEGYLTIITTPDNMFLNKTILFSNIKCDNFRCLWCCNGEGFDYVLALQVNNAQNIDLFINYNGLSMCLGSFDSIIDRSYRLMEDKNELLEGQLDVFFCVKKSGRQQYLSLFGESIESIVDLNSYETKIQEEPFYFDTCYFLFFDVETTGLFVQNGLKTDPRLVQLSWILTTKSGTIIKSHSYIVKPNKFLIPESSSDIHGITTSVAEEKGLVLNDVLMAFCRDMKRTKYYVGHNIDFDEKVILDEMERASIQNPFKGKEKICTMKSSANYCQIKNFRGIKYPKLEELYSKLFGHSFPNAHNATSDVLATMKCFFALQQKGVISLPDDNETCDDLPF